MTPTGVDVYMKLNCVMLMQLDPSFRKHREQTDTVVVKFEKALYGCIEASLLWYNDLK